MNMGKLFEAVPEDECVMAIRGIGGLASRSLQRRWGCRARPGWHVDIIAGLDMSPCPARSPVLNTLVDSADGWCRLGTAGSARRPVWPIRSLPRGPRSEGRGPRAICRAPGPANGDRCGHSRRQRPGVTRSVSPAWIVSGYPQIGARPAATSRAMAARTSSRGPCKSSLPRLRRGKSSNLCSDLAARAACGREAVSLGIREAILPGDMKGLLRQGHRGQADRPPGGDGGHAQPGQYRQGARGRSDAPPLRSSRCGNTVLALLQ
jgi:hypothetical protein